MGQDNQDKSKPGRLPVREQKLLQAKIKPYFENNYSANFTAKKTNVNRKTVQNYFKAWAEELADNSDFVSQQQEAKDRLVLALDQRILTYNEQIARIQNQIKKKPTIALETVLAQVNRSLASLLLDKAGVLITPTMDVQIEQILKDKHGIDLAKIKESIHANRS